MPIYEFTSQLATLEPPPPETQQLLGAISGNQAAMDAFVRVVDGSFTRREIELKPGKYTVLGTRSGYRDVRRDVRGDRIFVYR